VKQGECIESIAFEHGLFWQTVWNHPDNAQPRREEILWLVTHLSVFDMERADREGFEVYRVHGFESRLRNRVQISTDSFAPYVAAVKHAFGDDVDYAQIVKSYEEQPSGRGRYSPPRIVAVTKDLYMGTPDVNYISTSYVERQNLSIRMQVRRLTRLTNAFSKKVENLRAAMDLHFCHYNFVRFHRSLRCTPAMAIGIAPSPLSVTDLVEMAA
jgi:hypothetical protein